MTHRIALYLIALATCAFSTVSAEIIGAQTGAFYSYLNPSDAESGNGGGVIFRSQLVSVLGADVRAGYVDFGGADLTMIPLEAALIVRAPVPFLAMYGGIGSGVYFFEGDQTDYDNNIGFFPLVGAEFKLSELVLFAEGRYLLLEADAKDGSESIKLDGPGFNLGVSFRF